MLKGGNKKRWKLSLGRIADVGLIVLDSSVVDRWFYPLYAKTYNIGYYFFSAHQEEQRLVGPSPDSVSQWSDMSICGQLYQSNTFRSITRVKYSSFFNENITKHGMVFYI